MATLQSDENFVEEFLKCQICSEVFDDQIRIPKILGCMHTLCEQCLTRLMEEKSEVLCPYCRNTWKMPSKGFPENILVKAQLYKRKIITNPVPQEIDCESCPNKPLKIAVGFCNDCEMNVCKNCIEIHKLMRVTKDHEIEDLPSGRIPTRSGSIKSRCQRHPNQLLTVFCSTCEITLCNTCCITTHDGHQRVDLQSAVGKTKNNLTVLAEQSRAKRSPIYSLLSSIDALIDDIDSVRSQKEDEVEDLFHLLEKEIKEQCKRAKGEVYQQCEAKKHVLKAQRSEVEGICAEYEIASEFAEKLCELSNPKQLMDLQLQVTTRLKEMIDRGNKHAKLQVPLANNYLPFDDEHARSVTNFREVIAQIGRIRSSPTLPSLCYVEPSSVPSKRQESGALINRRQQKMKVYAMGFDGEPRRNEHGGDPFIATITGPDKSVTECTVEDNGDGTYTVCYTPQVSGQHSLDVNVFDAPISGSPFSFKVNTMKYIPVNLRQFPVVEAQWQEAPIARVPHCIDLNISSEQEGREQEAKVDIIEAKIRTNDDEEVPCKVSREGGDVKIIYTPPRVGNLSLAVKVNGQPLAHPFEIFATSLDNSLINWKQQQPAVVGQREVITVVLKDHAQEEFSVSAVSLGVILTDSSGCSMCKPRTESKIDSKYEFECTYCSSGTKRVDLQINGITVKTVTLEVPNQLNFTMPKKRYSFPTSVETSSSNVIFFSDTKLGSIHVRSSENRVFPSILVDTKGDSSQIAIDEHTSMFLLVPEQRDVLVYTTQGRRVNQWGCHKKNKNPVNIATSKHGQEGLVAIGDAAFNSSALFLYQKNGTFVSSIPLPSGCLMDGLDNVCIDNQQCVLICHYDCPEIIKINSNGEQVKTFKTPHRKSNQLAITATPEDLVLVSEKGRIILYDLKNDVDVQIGKIIEVDDHIYTSLSVTSDGCVIALDVGRKQLTKYGYLHL